MAAEKVSLEEYHDIVTRTLENTNRDAILLDLGRLLAQVTEDALTPSQFETPAFRDVTDTLLDPRDAMHRLPYTETIHKEILDRLDLGADDYVIRDTEDELAEPTRYGRFTDIHVELFIDSLGMLGKEKEPLERVMDTVIRDTARLTLMDKERLADGLTVMLGEDHQGSAWVVTDAQVKTHHTIQGFRFPRGKALTLENADGLTVEIVNASVVDDENKLDFSTTDLSFRFRDEHNKNWSNYIGLPEGKGWGSGGNIILSARFFNEIEAEIEQELKITAHEH